jgi:hypothetical protein
MPCNTRDSAVQGQEVSLQIQYLDTCGKPIVADDIPEIEITDLDGNIIVVSTSTNVSNLGDGLYEYIFRVPNGGDAGLWVDEWSAVIDSATLNTSFTFTVTTPALGLKATTGPGKILLGDDVNINFSDEELAGVNLLMKFLKSRLRSNGVKPVRDEFGAFVYDGYGELVTEQCNVFEDEILAGFLCQALSEFNSVPFFTAYAFSDQIIQTLFAHIIVEGAYVFALASQAIVEKGRDFTISDGGVSYQPPQLGDFLQSHYGTWLTSYRERLQFIKNSIRPGPRSYGTHTNLTGAAPAYTRLRHLRARRII